MAILYINVMDTALITTNVNNSSPFRAFEKEYNEYLSYRAKPSEYDQLTLYYKEKQQQEGVIAKSWDKIKIMLGFKNNSQNVEKALEDYKNNNSEENYNNAVNLVNGYAKSQNSAVVAARNFVSCTLASLGVFLLSRGKVGTELIKKLDKEGVAGLKILAGSILGGLGGIGLKKADAMTAKREYSKEEMTNDFMKGSVQGAMSACADVLLSLTDFVKNKFAKMIAKKAIRTTGITLSTAMESYKYNTSIALGLGAKIISGDKFDELNKKLEESKVKDTDEITFYGNDKEVEN